MKDFEQFDIEEYDIELMSTENYDSLRKLRKLQLDKHPTDFQTRYNWAEILIITGEPDQAMEVLEKLHAEEPDHDDVIYLMLDCLKALNRDPNDYRWFRKPKITYLNVELIDEIKQLLHGQRGRKRTVGSMYTDLLVKKTYLFFDEDELLDYLRKSERVQVSEGSWFDAKIEGTT